MQYVKSFIAVVVSFVSVALISMGADYFAENYGVIPGMGQALPASFGTAFVLGYRIVFDTFGAYLAARLAPNYPMRHALFVGALGTVICVFAALTPLGEMGPWWYVWGLAASSLPSAWVGGKLFQK